MLYGHTLGRAARYFPNNAAVVDGERRLTYGELARRVDRLAARLSQQGFVAGDRLAFVLPNGLEFIELTFACCRLGVLAVPINTRYAPPEIDAVIRDATPKGLVLHAALPRPTIRPDWYVVIGEENLEGCDGPLPTPFYAPEAVFGLFYTSGTTGVAKGVMITHANLLADMHHTHYWSALTAGDVWMHAAPMFHIADFPLLLVCSAMGVTQVTVPRFDCCAVCEAIARERVTHTVLIPTMVNFLTQYGDLERFDLSSLRSLVYGGSPMAPEIIKRTREKLPGCRLGQGYGLTETSPLLTALPDEDHCGRRMLSCGRPLPGIELAIIDEEGRPVERGKPGEIAARGANIMKGYWNKPEETRHAFINGWFRTGDIAYEDEDGYCYIVDRRKDMIVTGGENVYSTEVEAVIYSHPAVREAAVIGVPDSQWGEAVMACVALKDGASLKADQLIEYCRGRLANYKLPRRIEFVSGELPKSGTGKILKRVLREPFWKGQTRSVS
jgi:long-chain acyl-CoA synthetase